MFIIVDTNSQAVLGPDTCEQIQLIKQIFHIDTNLPAFLGKY